MYTSHSAFHMICIAVVLAISSLAPLPVLADYQRAVELYNQGDYAAAYKEFLPLAEEGDMDAEQAIGLLYEYGRGVQQDYAEAARWYERAALQGHEIAAGNLGVLYRDGLGVKKDFGIALRWLRQAAMANESYAMHNLGAMYANGQGTPVDPVEGWAWVSLAVQRQKPGADEDLARIAKQLSPQDLERARARSTQLREKIDNGETDSGYQAPASSPPAVEATKQPPMSSELRWQDKKEKGFSLRLPADWTVRGDETGKVEMAGSKGEQLIVWPMFSSRKISNDFAPQLLESITRKLHPGGRLPASKLVKPGAVKATGVRDGREFAASLAWTATPAGDAATYVLASAPQGSFNDAVAVFAEIMKSFTLHGSGSADTATTGGASSGRIAYTSFTDPTEGAFTVEVPSGWRVQGGVARFNASDVRPWLRLASSDGGIQVLMGDPQIPSMLVPNAALASMGYTEGMIYDAGYNQRFLLKSYAPGKESARLYAENNLAGDCAGGVVEDYRDRPEVSAAMNGIFRAYGSPFASQELHTGEISRSCPKSGRAQYVFAGTLLTQIPTAQGVFGMWVLNYLYGFDAPRDDAATALAVTRHMADSFRVTPQWAQMNTDLQSNVSEIVAKTGAAIADSVSKGYWNAQRSREKSMAKYGKAILGVEETLDPLTGETIEVVSGYNHAWVDPKGYVVGTQTHTKPNIDYRELLFLDR